MCGIAALLTEGHSESIRAIREMNSRLRHRGPDDEGFVFLAGAGAPLLRGGPDCPEDAYGAPYAYAPERPWRDESPVAGTALGQRRLSILDLTPAGHQPMCSPDRRYWIAYNGEVYNYVELRRELEGLGRVFHSRTDTEVILAAYAVWGEACQSRLNGMWAFVLVDAQERRVLASRDRFGIKPLYYTPWKNGLAFASEIKALLELPGIGRRVNPTSLFEYLKTGVTDRNEETFFEGIRRVPAAHALSFSLDAPRNLESRRYWSIDLNRRSSLTFPQAAECLREMFLQNIRIHLRSDVPVGAALSGGIDSSSIVMSMRTVQGADLDLHTFSYIADDPKICEERWVDMVGQAARAKVHKIHSQPDELVADLDNLIGVQDEPFGGTSIYAQHRVFRKAQEVGIKVMLDGQGADELFAGYEFFAVARLFSALRSGHWGDAWGMLSRGIELPKAPLRTLLLKAGKHLFPERVQSASRRLFGEGVGLPWVNASWFEERHVRPQPPTAVVGADPFRRKLFQTLVDTGLPMLLRFEDRNSMAHSIESRVPFLTADLAEFAFSLPGEYLISADGTRKAILRAAMRGIVPDAVLNRRDKIGFATPENSWLMLLRPWVERLLHGETAQGIKALNMTGAREYWRAGLAGRERLASTAWRWINLIRWSERYQIAY